jgi:UDP-3-O-[3-hydroxymyristoyl] glucosamine N-acyltransferase
MTNITNIINWAIANNLNYKIGKNVSLNDDIDSPWNIVEASQNQISFIDNGWRDNNAGIVFSKEYPDNINNVVIITNTPKLDFIKCINEFFKPNPCKIFKGDNVIIGEYCSIGKDGYQYILDETTNKLIKFPHFGNIILEEDVEIGNNVCIARGALSNTILRKGVKVDNLVHIAHNVDIGENTQIIAHAMIAGSVKIGKNCWISPSSCIKNQLTIGDNVLIGMGAVVINNVDSNCVMIGNPAKLLRMQ